MQRARRLRFSPQFAVLPEKTQQQLKRVSDVTKLLSQMTEILDREDAPFRIYRWVAWGHALQDRVVRLALVLLLRSEVDARNPGRATTRWLWAKDPVLTAGERAFYASPQHSRLIEVLGQRQQSDAKVVQRITMNWDRVWALLQRAMGSFDAKAFLADAQRCAAARHRRSARKIRARRLGPKEAAYVDALETLKRGVLRGDVTIEELADERVLARSTSAPARKTSKR